MIDSSSIRVHQHGANGPKFGGSANSPVDCLPDGRGDPVAWVASRQIAPQSPVSQRLTGRADHQDPRPGRCARPPDPADAERGAGLGRPRRRAVAGRDPRRLPSSGRPCLRQQRHPGFAGRSGRRGRDPFDAAAQPGHPARPRGLQGTQSGRAFLQHPSRRCRHRLPVGGVKHFRAVATRYDKRDDNYLASVQLASIRIWLRSYETVT